MITYEDSVQSRKIKKMCESFHLVGGIYTFEGNPGNPGNGRYIIAGTKIPDNNIDLPNVIDYQNRNTNLFFPKLYAVKLSDVSFEKAQSHLLDYLQDAEFVDTIFKYHDKKTPDYIDASNLMFCKEYNKWAYNKQFQINAKGFMVAREALINEMTTASKFDDVKDVHYNKKRTVAQSIKDLFNTDPQCVDFETLMGSCTNIAVLEYTEAEFKNFRKQIKLCPDVIYATYKKVSADMGKVVAPKGTYNPFEGEETKLSLRLIAVNAESLPAIANAFNEYEFKDVGNDSPNAQLVLENGPVRSVTLSDEEVYYFLDLVQKNKIPFFVDYKSQYDKPEIGFTTVVLPQSDSAKIQQILDTVFTRVGNGKHDIEAVQKNWLDDQIHKAEEKKNKYGIDEEKRKRGELSWSIE